VPRSIAMNDQMLPRRQKAAAVEQKERGLIMQIVFHSPKDTLAAVLALTAILAIIVNALFMQAGRHPSPLFGTMVPVAKSASTPPAVQKVSAIPATQPQQAASQPPVAASPMPRPRPAEAEVRPGDALGNLVRSTSAQASPAASAPRPPAAVPAASSSAKADVTSTPGASQRVAAVQRALTDYGYGQIKATGTVGADTQAAIQKFERERKLPITGQMSERLVRELGLATGRTFE
jgi:hypothetical protein